jgi:hypothetical protein
MLLLAGMFMAAVLAAGTPAEAGWNDVFKDVMSTIQESTGVSEAEIVEGLRQALEVGTDNAVINVSALDGYFKNQAIKILLPEEYRQMEQLLRSTGMGGYIDRFVLSMNRAAETAAPEARKLFWNALKQMTFDDARRILDGRDNEATLYFEAKTRDSLTRRFTPIVHSSMASVGVTKAYQDLDAKIQTIPFIADRLRFDLDAYVTAKALDGLFVMVAKEEKAIRENPQARVTELLKKVFGKSR